MIRLLAWEELHLDYARSMSIDISLDQSKTSCHASLIRYIDLFIRLKLKWIGADGTATPKTLRVNLFDVPQSKIVTCGQSTQEKTHSCANAETREACEKFCGIGSGVLRWVPSIFPQIEWVSLSNRNPFGR